MQTVSESFALTLNVKYFHFKGPKPGELIIWSQHRRGVYNVTVNTESAIKFTNEVDAWAYSIKNCPWVLSELRNSGNLLYQGYALRCDMRLSYGEARFSERMAQLQSEILSIFDTTLEVMGSTRATKVVPKVVRVSYARSISWFEAKTRIVTPFEAKPLLMSVRCIPSLVDDKTWGVRIRMGTQSVESYQHVQSVYAELVTRMGYQGIVLQDVLNGTYID